MLYQVNYKFQFPVRLIYGYLKCDGAMLQLPTAFPTNSDWGEIKEGVNFSVNNVTHIEIEVGWIAIETGRTFYFSGPLSLPEQIVNNDDITLLIGLGPIGEIAIWLRHELQCMLYLYTSGVEITDKMTDKMIRDTNFVDSVGNPINTIVELCKDDIAKFSKIPGYSIVNKSDNYFNERMKRYNYRYEIINIPQQDCSIYEWLADATYYKFNNPDLKNYHSAAKPMKFAIEWEKNDNAYSVYFWMDEIKNQDIFNRFYGAHPETKTDFMIQINVEKNKYELALYRYGMKEPYLISESAYQLIVFKNKFEYYRSENYNQPRGAWIW